MTKREHGLRCYNVCSGFGGEVCPDPANCTVNPRKVPMLTEQTVDRDPSVAQIMGMVPKLAGEWRWDSAEYIERVYAKRREIRTLITDLVAERDRYRADAERRGATITLHIPPGEYHSFDEMVAAAFKEDE